MTLSTSLSTYSIGLVVNWTTFKFFGCRWAAKELCRTAKLAPLATRHRRRSPQPISTYWALLSTYGPAQYSSLFPRVERTVVWTRLQLLGDVSMPSERRRSTFVPGADTKERESHHAPSPEANYLLRIILQLEPESTGYATSPQAWGRRLLRCGSGCGFAGFCHHAWMRNRRPLIAGL